MNAPHRRRASRWLAVLALATLVLAGCSGQKEPGSYTDGVKRDFTSGCWTTLIEDAYPKDVVYEPTDDREKREAKAVKAATDAEVTAAKDYCSCAYKGITKDVKFSEFKQINEDLRNEQGPLPESFQKAYDHCELPESLQP